MQRKVNVVEDLDGKKIVFIHDIRFKGRQMAHTEIGKDVLLRFSARLSELSDIEQQPKLDGRSMTMLLTPKK